MAPQPPNPLSERHRLSLDLSPQLTLLLDNASTILGIPKSQVAVQAILDGLPAVLARVDTIVNAVTAHPVTPCSMAADSA